MRLLKASEGCRLKSYRDSANVLTVGWGHCGQDVTDGMVITQDEADRLLLEDLREVEQAIERLVKTEISSNEHASLCVFVFNIGVNAFKRSTLLKLLNAGDRNGASKQFGLWNKIRDRDGKSRPLAGLTLRRRNEAALFTRPDRG
jgi:lysozyme